MTFKAFVLPLAGLIAGLTLAACQERTPQAQGRDCERAAARYLPGGWGPRTTEVIGDSWSDLTVKMSAKGQTASAHCTFQITKFGASLDEMTLEGVEPWPMQMYYPSTRRWLTEEERQARIRNELSPRDGAYAGQTWQPGWGPYEAGLRLSGRCWKMQGTASYSANTLHACGAEQGFRYFVTGKRVWIELPGLPPGIPEPGPNKMEDGAPAPPATVFTWGPEDGGPFNPPQEPQTETADAATEATSDAPAAESDAR